tara:strand:+ start:914 stop:2311 length:1398 start_codon:yes stop_codon:yes gene_type:complete
MSGIFSPEQISIASIRIEAERFPQGQALSIAGYEVTGAPIAVEFNMYESMFKPYTTAALTIQDDADLYRLADISGVERVIIEFEAADFQGSLIKKTYIIRNVEKSVKSNDYTNMINLSLVEDIKYYNDLNTISRAYTGTGEKILSDIIRDQFNRELVIEAKDSFQKEFRFIVPYLTAFDAIKKILSKMSTELGMPYFLYSSIYSDDFILTDLETIIGKPAFNDRKPFTYSQAQANMASGDLEAKALSIINYSGRNLENTLALAKGGGIGSRSMFIDATSGQVSDNHINMFERLSVLVDNDLINPDHTVISIDNEFIADPSGIDRRTIGDFNTANFNMVTSSPYPELVDGEGQTVSNSVLGFNEDDRLGFSSLRLIKEHFISNLVKNVYNIFVPGLVFSYKNNNTSVGNVIQIEIMKNNVETNEIELTDSKRSGNFLMLSKAHIFNIQSDTHNVSIDISRITNRVD